ncbi:MAG: hypothetical protein ABSA16_17020 [Thermoguttaceae bacterium]|jgi:hypothetical protein
MESKSIDITNAERIFAIANDPLFLFKRLRDDFAVQRVKNTYLPNQIIDWLNQNASQSPTTLHKLVEIYVYLVALALYNRDEVILLLKDFNLPDVRWGNIILQYIKNSLKSTSYQEIKCPPQLFSGVRQN